MDRLVAVLGEHVVVLTPAMAARIDRFSNLAGEPRDTLFFAGVRPDAVAAAPEGVVRWIAASSAGAQFHATPLSIRDPFARARERAAQAWILTSATLTVAARFDAFLEEIGLNATTRRWDSPLSISGATLNGMVIVTKLAPSAIRAAYQLSMFCAMRGE